VPSYTIAFRNTINEDLIRGFTRNMLRPLDFPESAATPPLPGSESFVLLPEIGAALADIADPDIVTALRAHPSVLVVAPVVPLRLPRTADTLRDALPDESNGYSWNLTALGIPEAHAAGLDGTGVRVALLDDGLNGLHPDFAQRQRQIAFAPPFNGDSTSNTDVAFHGTEVGGVIFGPPAPVEGPRYGIAPGCSLYVARIASGSRGGSDTLLAGINWAISNRCRVINMSCELALTPETASQVALQFAGVQRKASQGDVLLVGAAGNDAQDQDTGIGLPAALPRCFCVAATTASLVPHPRSKNAVSAVGGEINLSAPGEGVYTSTSLPASGATARYRRAGLTSIAAPQVTGIAVLLLGQRQRSLAQLWADLEGHARTLDRCAVGQCGFGLAHI